MTKTRFFLTIVIATIVVALTGGCAGKNLFALPAAQAGTSTKVGQAILPLVIKEMTDGKKGKDVACKLYGQEGGVEPQLMLYNGASLALVTPAMKEFVVCQATLLSERLEKGKATGYTYLHKNGVDVTPPSPCATADIQPAIQPATVATALQSPSPTRGSGLGVNDAAARQALANQLVTYKQVGLIQGVEVIHVTGLNEGKGCGNPCVAGKWYGSRLQLMYYNMTLEQAKAVAADALFIDNTLAIPKPGNPEEGRVYNYTTFYDGCSPNGGVTKAVTVAPQPAAAIVASAPAPAYVAPAPPCPPAVTAPAVDLRATVEANGGQVTTDKDGKTVFIMKEDILFDSGSATLSSRGKAFIKSVARALTTCQAILVSGHTDNVPIHNANFSDNNALSEARAKAVAEELAANGVPRELIVAIGYGETRPVASNATAEGRARNRRVEIRLN